MNSKWKKGHIILKMPVVSWNKINLLEEKKENYIWKDLRKIHRYALWQRTVDQATTVKVWSLHFTDRQTPPYVKLGQDQINNCEFIFRCKEFCYLLVIPRKKGKYDWIKQLAEWSLVTQLHFQHQFSHL